MSKLRHKFNAKQTILDGIKFQSKKEANRYLQLKILKEAGEVLFFLMQVPFRLPGGVIYKCDFQVFWTDGTITFEDPKGARTDLFIAKKKMVEAIYPVEIIEL